MFILTSHNDGSGSTLNASSHPTFDAASDAMKADIQDLYNEMHREYREADGELYDDEAALDIFGVMYEWKTIYLPEEWELLDVSENQLRNAKEYAAAATVYDRRHFMFDGSSIVNPWMDPTGRFSLTTEEAIKMYGLENVRSYVKDPIFNLSVSKVRMMEFLQRYIDFDLEATETEYVQNILTDVCGMSDEEIKELGFDYLWPEDSRQEVA